MYSWTGSWPRFSRELKQGSSVEISAMDSLTSKTWIVWIFQQFIRQYHQYLSNRKLTLIFEVTQTWQLSKNVSSGFIDFGYINKVEIVKIHKTVLMSWSRIWVNSWNFELIRAVFLRSSSQDGVRIIFNHRDYLNYFRMHNLLESCVQIGWKVFELAKKM